MNNLLVQLWWRFRGVRVIALVGKSGTGKSFRARLVMEKYNIDLLIDDGLLIRDQKIVAGTSAKRATASMPCANDTARKAPSSRCGRGSLAEARGYPADAGWRRKPGRSEVPKGYSLNPADLS